MNKNLTIISLIFIGFHAAIAQGDPPVQFYLAPHIGGEWPLSAFENKGDKPPYVTNNTLEISAKYGISFIADFKRKFSLELGYGWGNVGWGVNYKSQTDSAQYEISGSSSSDITVRRLSLKFVKPVTSIKIKRRKEKEAVAKQLNIPDEFRYWTIFDVNLIGGFSYEDIPPFFVNSGHLGIGSFGDTDNVVLSGVTQKLEI